MLGQRDIQRKQLAPEVHAIPASRPESPLLKDVPTSGRQGWPSSPGLVSSSRTSIAMEIGVDLMLFSCAIAFFAFGLTVRYYDRTPTEEHPRTTEALVEASKYGPSVFPILFDCVVGRATQSIMIWRLETGERIGILDLLAGSSSLTSVVTTQMKLRLLSITGLALLLIWALSPVGGQSSTRQLSIGAHTESTPTTFVYIKFNGNIAYFEGQGSGTSVTIVNSLFISSILAPPSRKAASLDTWNNVRIPMIEAYEDKSTPDEDGWYSVNQEDSIYSSLVGIPIAGLTETAAYEVKGLQTQYFNLDCPVVASDNWSVPEGAVIADGCRIWSTDNTTARYRAGQSIQEPRRFSFEEFGSTRRSNCDMMTTYVEVDLSCGSTTSCAVSKIRRSSVDHPPPAYTLIDRYAQGWEVFSRTFANSVKGYPGYPTVMTNYLTYPEDPLQHLMAPGMAHLVSGQLPPSKREYEERLGQLMNTYWLIMNAFHAVTAGMTTETAWMRETNKTDSDAGTFFSANSSTTQGTRSIEVPVIVCNKPWFAVLSISSLLMVVASLIHPTFRFFLTTAPDVMLNISSLATRTNPHFAGPSNDTFMAASDRARLLKNMRMKFRDVDHTAGVGTLAVGSLDPEGPHSIACVQKKRKYK